MKGDVFYVLPRGIRMLDHLERSRAETPHIPSGKLRILPNGDVTEDPVEDE